MDEEIGAGHLNVRNALQNLSPGEYESGTVPPIGWDFGSVAGGGFMEYVFDQAVSGWVAITLAWNRIVQSTELAGPDNYVSGDQFFSSFPNNLDLYLLNENNSIISSSTTLDDNLEHIFANVPAGQYKIQVVYNEFANDLDYGLAWWAGEAPATQLGDFDSDGDVDGRDFLVWQRTPSVGNLADWQANYGTGAFAAASVPEPNTLMLAVLFITVLPARLRFAAPRG